MVYIIGWFVIYSALLLQALTRYRGALFAYMAVFYLFLVAFLRGNSGTDTAGYEGLVSRWVPGYIWNGMEPGFIAIGAIFYAVTSSPEVAVRLFALLFFVLTAIFVKRATQDERFLLMAYLLPAFAYQYSMNTLRVGLGSVILLLAIQSFRLKGKSAAMRVGLSALLFHYSTLVSIVYIFVSQRPWLRFGAFVGSLSLLLFTALIFLAVDEYFLLKFASYRDQQIPGPLSGLRKVVPLLIILIGVILEGLPRSEKIKLIFLGSVFLILGWVVSRYTIAGLRILDLVAFAGPAAILISYWRANLSFGVPMKCALVFAGLLSSAGVYRYFLSEAGEGRSPFLPYSTFF